MGYSIGQASDLTHLSTHTLRYYEKEGLITPQRTDTGLRDYTDQDIEILLFISCMKKTGMPIHTIASFINLSKDDSEEAAEQRMALLLNHATELEKQITTLQEHLHYLHKKIAWCRNPQSCTKPQVPQKIMTSL